VDLHCCPVSLVTTVLVELLLNRIGCMNLNYSSVYSKPNHDDELSSVSALYTSKWQTNVGYMCGLLKSCDGGVLNCGVCISHMACIKCTA
jgi:hypothetical protein